MRAKGIAIGAGLTILMALSGCSGKEACLPKGEKAIVLRKGSDGGQRYVTLKRSNGEEVTCIGDTTPIMLTEGDEVDGWTMSKADGAKSK